MTKLGSAVCTDLGVLVAVDEADEGVRLLLLTVGVRDRDRDRWSMRLLPSLAALKLDGVAL